MLLKDIITESFLLKFLYMHIGVVCFFIITAIVEKFLLHKNRILKKIYIILEIAIPITALITSIVCILFGYLNHEFRFWVGIFLFLYYLKMLEGVIRRTK